jgi:HemY protein
MVKLLWRFLLLVLVALAVAWLADRPGSVTIQWMGREIHLTVFVGLMFLLSVFVAVMVIYGLLRRIWRAPASYRGRRREKKTRRAYESLSRGIIAAGAGDAHGAARHAALAGETLTSEPLVKLLSAQAAQLRGDRDEVKRVFETMADAPETELLGLRGLFADARAAGDWQAARRHAEAAHGKNSRLPWAAAAVLQALVAHKDWLGAARNIAAQGKAGLMPRDEANRKQAALLTAQALMLEDTNSTESLRLATEAHGLDVTLVPAAAVLTRQLSTAGNKRKANKVLHETWLLNPHRDLAALGGQIEGGSAEIAFERVRDLVGATPGSDEGRIALARAAISAQRHDVAREILAPMLAGQPQASVCGSMAQIEDAAGNASKSREWLARALHAPRDPIWVSDGVASPHWVPVSPVTGEIVPCEWKPPFEQPPGGQLQFQPEAENGSQPALSPAALAGATKAQSAPVARLPDDPGPGNLGDEHGS